MGEDAFIHLGLVKMRVVGSGTMGLRLKSFDDLDLITIPFLTLTPTSNRVQQRLANYVSQGIVVGGFARNIDDSFRTQDITLYFKQIWTEYPM